MKLCGLHHITMITADAGRTVEFYGELLGLRLVKTTVNFDAPEAYHLYFGDERGTPGSILTWFEFPGAAPGHPGRGMVHTLCLGVGSESALGFWAERLRARGYAPERTGTSLCFADHEGLGWELVVDEGVNAPLAAVHPEIAPEHAIIDVVGARAYAADPSADEPFLTATLGFSARGPGAYRLSGRRRVFYWTYDAPAPERPRPGAGTVHHIAWASRDEDHLGWQQRVREAGLPVTDVRDRDYFKSIYFHEPRGILFEIATLSPGFAVDEEPEHLGEALRLPTRHEHLRPQLQRSLTPIANPRARHRAQASAGTPLR